MDSAKRKILPHRYNRGLRMAELEKNEAKLNENEQYNEIFKEDSSDDEFDPAVQEHVEDAEEEDDDDDDVDINVTSNDNELPNDDDVSYHSMKKHKKHVEEIIDIDQLDIDKIDYIEDLRDRGIEISDEDALDPRDRFSSIGNSDDDEDDEDYGKHHRNKKFNKAKAKKKAKNKAKKKGKVKKGNKDDGLFPIAETGGVVVDDININNNNLALTEDNNVASSSNLNEQHKAQSLQNVIVSTTKHNETIIIIPKSLLNINFDNVQFNNNNNILNVNEQQQQQQHDNITILNQKRIRTNKYADLIKKPKREKINKNVTILGSRNNPRSILINKNIYNEKDESQDYNDNKDNNNNNVSKSTLQHQSNSTNTNNILSFALEQEMDTKDLIRKIRQQEKEKKFGFQDKIISQEQRLFESIFTEWANKHSLQAMQKLEDLNKRENTTSNKKSFLDYVKISNSQKHIIAKQNGNVTIDNAIEKDEHTNNTIKDINKVNVTFSNMTYYNKVFAFFNTKPKEKELKKCAITGEPARYYDPLTKSYYSSMDAFKLLREKYFQKEEDGLLFRIQTLSDLASQKKERVKKMIWIDNTNTINAISSSNNNNHQNSIEQIKQGMRETNTNAIMNIVNKYGIWRADGDNEKRVISHRIYNRNRENCVESGMLLEASKIKLVISKKIFKDKFSSKIPT